MYTLTRNSVFSLFSNDQKCTFRLSYFSAGKPETKSEHPARMRKSKPSNKNAPTGSKFKHDY